MALSSRALFVRALSSTNDAFSYRDENYIRVSTETDDDYFYSV